MKTTKSTVVVLFVLLATQVVSAYYCPSTGHWLSRDPIGEPGFQALQATAAMAQVGNPASFPPSRWINRDSVVKHSDSPPVGNEDADVINPNELLIAGGVNIYCFNGNDAIVFVDSLGLSPFCVCIRADSDHAWIAVTDLATGQTTTYGRWKIGYGHPAASSSGVLINMETGRHYAAQRCVQVQTFTPTINAGYDTRNNNCATYAASIWNSVSGESLADRDSILFVGYDSPDVLANSIAQANAANDKSKNCCSSTK